MLDQFDDIRLRDLIFFDRLVQLRTITAAAEDLQVPKPTASRWLASLEAKAGHQLMVRGSRQLTLTTKGESFLRQIQPLLAGARTLRASIQSHRPQGTLRVSVPIPMRRLVGGSVISEFRRQLPDVRLEILIQNEAVDLVRDRIDIAIQRGPTSDSSLTVRHLAKVPLWLYAGTQTSGSGSDTRALIAAPGDEALLQATMPELLPAAVVVDDRTSVRDALLEGDGVGVLPAFLGEQPRVNGLLLRSGNEPLSIIQIEAVSLPEQANDIRTRALLDLIVVELKELLGQG